MSSFEWLGSELYFRLSLRYLGDSYRCSVGTTRIMDVDVVLRRHGDRDIDGLQIGKRAHPAVPPSLWRKILLGA